MPERVSLSQMQLVLDPWHEAARALEEARDRNPGFADLRNLLGQLLLMQGRPAEAGREFEAALALNPGYRRARFNLLVASRQSEGFLDPAIWSRENLVSDAGEPEASLWTAWFLAQSGDREGVRQCLKRLSSMQTWTGLAAYVEAVFEASWGDSGRSREALRRAAIAHPLYRSVLESRGILTRSGAPERRGHGEPLIPPGSGPESWNPLAGELFEYLGTLCARNGRVDLARQFYEDAFLRQGDESTHRIRLSHLALAQGDEEEAVRSLRRAIEVDPTSVPARTALGFEYQSQGYPDEALVQFEVAARLHPEYPDVQYNLGLLYGVQGRSEDAVRCLRRALEINPAYFQARASLAQLLLRMEAHDEALKELEILGSRGLRSADLHVQKAEAHLAVGQAQEALAELELATRLNPSYARSYHVLGTTYQTLGLRRKAQNAWKQYLEYSRSWSESQPAQKERELS